MEDEIELKEQQEAFNVFDHNKDGMLDEEEAPYAFMALGWCFSPEEISNIMKNFGHNGLLSFEEFSHYLQTRSKDNEMELELMQTFTEMDKDGDGKISAKDLKYLLYSLGEKFSDEEINEIITQTSNTNDGFIHYKDMVKMILQK